MLCRSAVALGALVLVSGCATIMHGTNQEVGISSTPSQAVVKVNGVSQGQTPVVSRLSRKQSHIVRLELDGYQPYETTLTKSVSGWVWGNIVFGGFIGLAVDAATGGLYQLTPTQVQAQMAQAAQPTGPGASQSASLEQDGLYIRVVLRPDPTWKKVGELTRD